MIVFSLVCRTICLSAAESLRFWMQQNLFQWENQRLSTFYKRENFRSSAAGGHKRESSTKDNTLAETWRFTSDNS